MESSTNQSALRQGYEHLQAGRLVAAENIYRQILGADPTNSDALYALAVTVLRDGRRADAIALFDQYVTVAPRLPATYVSVGEALLAQNALLEAKRTYIHAVQLFPDSDELCYRLGHVEWSLANVDAAARCFERAAQLRPGRVEAYVSASLALEQIGQMHRALMVMDQAAHHNPDDAGIHWRRGNVLHAMGQLESSCVAYQRAVELRPDFAQAHTKLGATLKQLGRLDQAAASLHASLRVQPSQPAAYSELAGVLEWQAKHDEAVTMHRRAIALAPESPIVHGSLLFTMLFHPSLDTAAIRQEHDEWNRRHAHRLLPDVVCHRNDRSSARRIRVGYVGGLFRHHAAGHNLLPVIRAHDSDAFEVICYSNSRLNDSTTAEFQRMVAGWRDISAATEGDAAALIREDRIDVLVNTTMHMETRIVMIFAYKPAPVQVAFIAYPGSTGLEAIDYRFTDVHLDPPGSCDGDYVERSWRLPDSFWCYQDLAADVDVSELPSLRRSYITFGCLNNFSKINDRMLRLWAQVLGAVPGSRLLLLAHEGSHREHVRNVLSALGVTSDRLEFATPRPRREYLQLFHRVDISLDTIPYNGHTTSLDSLWMGVPVVTLVGDTVVGRAGLSQLTNLQLPELITRTPQAYIALAVALAHDRDRLRLLRQTLRARMQQSALMDGQRFARNIEHAYRSMWLRWCNDVAPAPGP